LEAEVSIAKNIALGALVGLPLSLMLWLTLMVVDLRNELDDQTAQTEALAEDLEDLEAALGDAEDAAAALEDRLEDVSAQLEAAIPRIRLAHVARACEAAIAAGPALPADWRYTCVAESPEDDAFGSAFAEREVGPNEWSGRIEVYYAEHLDFGAVGTPRFQAELVDTVYHEAHHAWCFRTGGTSDHEAGGQVPTCSIAVPINPPVGDWGGFDG
jgi:hypothetical protein